MAIAYAGLETGSGSTTNSDDYVTASFGYSTDDFRILAVVSFTDISVNPVAATATGAGGTWTQIASNLFDTAGTYRYRLTVLRSKATSSGTGAVTIDHGSDFMAACAWLIVRFTGVDITGTNAANAIVQSVTDSGSGSGTNSTADATLAAFDDALNATVLCTAGEFLASQHDPDTNMTLANDVGVTDTQDVGVGICYTLNNETNPRALIDTSNLWGTVAIELRDATGSPPSYTGVNMTSDFMLLGVG